MTNSGIYGFITGFDDDRVWLEIDDDVQIRVIRAAIQGKVDTSGAAAGPPHPAARQGDRRRRRPTSGRDGRADRATDRKE